MRNDVNCPYCNSEQDINYNDGYGYEEDKLHEQQCSKCDKYFTYTTGIIFVYESYQADCLNGAPHDFKPTITYPKEGTMMECVSCDARQKPTNEEMKGILAV